MRGFDARCRWPGLFLLAFSTLILPLWASSSLRSQEGASRMEALEPAVITVSDAHAPFIPTQEDVGDALMMHQRYQAAIEAYKRATPESSTLWNKMGIAYQMMFSAGEAQRCYHASLRLDPRNTRTLNNLATLYDSQKNYRAAEKLYRQALSIDPQSALGHKNLGTNLLAQRRFEEGWKAYQTALKLSPKIFAENPPLHIDNPASTQSRGAVNYYMARSCVRAGMTQRAIEYLRNALNEGFTNPRKIAADKEFASLRGIAAFEKLLTDHQGLP
jgi:tetratricopeptide (TPR) repeat protein